MRYTGLAVGLPDLTYGPAGRGFDLLVTVDEGPADALGQQPSDGRLAGAHHPDEHDVVTASLPSVPSRRADWTCPTPTDFTKPHVAVNFVIFAPLLAPGLNATLSAPLPTRVTCTTVAAAGVPIVTGPVGSDCSLIAEPLTAATVNV